MGGATIMEKYRGSSYVSSAIYSSAWFVALWTLLAAASAAYMLRRRLWRRPVTFMLHLSLLVILLGAAVTWIWGKEGTLHLRAGGQVAAFAGSNGERVPLDAVISFGEFNVVCYPGTDTPKSFECRLIIAGDTPREASVALNHVLSHNGVRYFLTSFDDDGEGVTLSVSKNSAGMGISYAGYALLIISVILFLLRRDTRFRALGRYKAACVIAVAAACGSAAHAAPRTVSPAVADALGTLHVYYNGRVCPFGTVARDMTLQLYDSRSYEGLSPEQVLAGWIFFPTDWLPTVDPAAPDMRAATAMLVSTDIMKIFPYRHDGLRWASPATRVDGDVAADCRMFMRRALDYVGEKIVAGDDAGAVRVIGRLREYQLDTSGDLLPSPTRFKAEQLYNRLPLSLPLAIFCMAAGIGAYIFCCRDMVTGCPRRRMIYIAVNTAAAAALAVLTFMLALRGYISCHWPMTNGYETMQCMAWCALAGALLMGRRFVMALPFGLIVAAMALLVAMMGEKNPAVTYIMPVLDSPWLCLHVMLVMTAYSLFAFVMLGGVTGMILRLRHRPQSAVTMAVVGTRVLYPAVFALAAGIFVGAVWANETWGRFWGWDPKEVWALITLLIYAAPLHEGFGWFKNGALRFHIYATAAFLSVAITYFGVNYLLGGLHSYAG